MRKRLFSMVCVSLAATGLAWADSLPAGRWDAVAEKCAREITLMHGVWRSGQVFLPAYADLHLVEYLASLEARHLGIAVIPVFTAEPLSFRGNHVVFLSTGLILKAANERELSEAVRGAQVEVEARDMPACGAMSTWTPMSFEDVHRRLAEQVAGYKDVPARQLRTRAIAAK